MQCRIISRKDKQIPVRLALLLEKDFPEITAAGNLDLLANRQKPITGLFCSRNCPGSLILPAFDHITALRDTGVTVASGFHSEMEQECLKILLRGRQPVIICPARAIQNMRIPVQWKKPLAENRLLILSPFDQGMKRPTVKLAERRNRLVAALADELFVIHTKKDTETFRLAVQAMMAGKKSWTIGGDENQAVIQAGVAAI